MAVKWTTTDWTVGSVITEAHVDQMYTLMQQTVRFKKPNA